MDITGAIPEIQAWQLVLFGFIIPLIAYTFSFVKWILPYVRKHQEVDRLVDINTIMETLQPVLSEIDKQMQLLAHSTVTIAEAQKLLASQMSTTFETLKTIKSDTSDLTVGLQRSKDDSK